MVVIESDFDEDLATIAPPRPLVVTDTEHFYPELHELLPIVLPHVEAQVELQDIRTVGKMAGKSAKIKEVFDLVEKMARSMSNVLLLGESGTGKEMVALTIHEQSKRRGQRFVAINCSAIPAQLLESELFGHKKGAFTGAQEARRGLFEEACGGTIFLDEIGDMSFDLQSKLLRVIQEREITPVGENKSRSIDVRIISATHQDLAQMVAAGTFRQDLYFRIAVVPIHLPALRERKDDIPLLAAKFLAKYCGRAGVALKQLKPQALARLLNHDWPGNVRELENTIERAVALSESQVIGESEIPSPEVIQVGSGTTSIFEKLITLDDLEKAYIQYVLTHTRFQKDHAAKILGINRKTLYRREVAYGLVEPRGQEETELA